MTKNANDSASTMEDIDQALHDELHQLELLPQETCQGFRPVYRNRPLSSTSTLDQDMFYITQDYDSELERDVIYWNHIVEKFEDVLFLECNSSAVEFIQDSEYKILIPFRFNPVPGVTLDVVIENPIDDTRTGTSPTAIEDSNANESGGDESSNVGNTNISKPSQSTDRNCIQNSDDFNTLQCISWIRGRGLTLTKAERGNAEAQTDIAIIYSYFLKDYTKAMEWSRKAASQGYPPAQSIIGQLYGMGHGASKDLSMAWRWYMKAAEQNDPVGQNGIGSMYQNGQVVAKDNSMAAEWYLKAADQGHAGAQRNLGSLYTEGLGVPKDYSKALEWFIKASNQGNILAQNDIGHLYQYGAGVPQNYSKALWWYQKAAGCGDPEGQLNVGTIYQEGVGTKLDRAKAMEWYLKAAKQGNRIAKGNIGLLYQLRAEHYKALDWYLEIANEEDIELMYKIAGIYLKSHIDHSKALEWFTKAGNKGHIYSQITLGSLYCEGIGVTQDYTKSFEWYRKAASQDSAYAQFQVGLIYYKGRGVPLDYQKALEIFSMAAAKHRGLFGGKTIALFYEYGYGVPVDFAKAKDWGKHHVEKSLYVKEKKRVYQEQ